MSLHFICLTATGGLPIFTRKKGDCDTVSADDGSLSLMKFFSAKNKMFILQLPFSTVGSLNGVHMFCKSQGVHLQNTHLDDGTLIVWKEFENSFTMIGIGKGYTEKILRDLLEIVFNATIFTIGLNEVKHNQNAEQFKRELKVSLTADAWNTQTLKPCFPLFCQNCYPIVDKLIENIDADLLKFSDCIIPSSGTEILQRLNEFSEQIGSPFCCVVVSRHKIVAGTDGWWDLNVIDRKLLITMLSATTAPQLDVPVYLPKKSPNIAYRFVSIPICQMISVCVVCGAEPTYADAMTLAQHLWRNDLEILRNAELCYPRNFSANLPQLDSSILGILLVNKTHKKYVMSRNLQPAIGNKRIINAGGHHRLDILRTFFHQAVDTIDKFLTLRPNGPKMVEVNSAKALESYWCSEYHKCHSYAQNENLICVLFVAAIPTHTMR